MVLKSDQFKNVVAQNIHINERHPDSVVEQGIQFSATSGFMMAPSKDVAARTDITGYVLTAYDNQGKTVWAEASGGGGSANPAGTVEGAIQFRNNAGDDLDANDSLYWNSGTTTLHIPGTISSANLSTTSGISTSGNTISGVTRLQGITITTADTDAASKAYVDSIAGEGVSWKNPVLAATVSTDGSLSDGNFSLISQVISGISIDTVPLSGFTGGERVLLQHQGSADENAVYEVVFPGTGGSTTVDFVLPADINGSKASGTAVFVESGGVNNDQGFVVTDVSGTDEFGNAGLSSVSWGQFTSNSTSAAGTLLGEIQFNDGSSGLDASTDFMFTTASQLLTVGNATDNGSIRLGTNRLDISHDGANGTLTNNLGTLTIDNDTRDVIVSDVILNEGNITASNILFKEDSGTELITLKAPTGIVSNFDIILPNIAGSDKQLLYSDASNGLEWHYNNSNYRSVFIIAGSGGGEYDTGTPYDIQIGDRFVLISETSNVPTQVANMAVRLPPANTTNGGMIVTIADKSGLSSNNTTGTIEIHVSPSSGDHIKGWNGASFDLTEPSSLDLAFTDFVGYTLLSDGVNTWQVIA